MTSMPNEPETVNPVESIALARWQAAINGGTVREQAQAIAEQALVIDTQSEIIDTLKSALAARDEKVMHLQAALVLLECKISDERAKWEGVEPLLYEVVTSLHVDDEEDGIERRLFVDGQWRDVYALLRGPFGHAPEEAHSRRWANALAQILRECEVPELRCHEGHAVGDCPGPCTVCLTNHCESPIDCARDAASEAARDRGRL